MLQPCGGYGTGVRCLPSAQVCGCPRMPAIWTRSIVKLSAILTPIPDPGLSFLDFRCEGILFSLLALNGLLRDEITIAES